MRALCGGTDTRAWSARYGPDRVEDRQRTGREAADYIAVTGAIDGTPAPALFTDVRWSIGVARAKNPDDLTAFPSLTLAAWIAEEAERTGGPTPMELLRRGNLAEVLHLINAASMGAYS